jgi:hypothetical protein
MVVLNSPLYLALAEDKAIIDCFSLEQQIGPKPKLRVYSYVELQSMLSPAQSEFVNPMGLNLKLAA